MKKGMFIVLDGSDGAGKTTQARMLAARLKGEKLPHEVLDFPSYNRNFFGTLIADCLAGKCGDFVHLDPKIASVLYALDRFEEAPRIKAALAEGNTVITDRFTSSNQIHQGGKIRDPKAREDFLIWLDGMEHATLGVPKPDAVIYFHIPLALSKKLLERERPIENASMGTGKDTVEQDEEYLAHSHETAEWLAKRQPTWHVIECAKGEQLRSPEDIHEEVYALLQKLLAGN